MIREYVPLISQPVLTASPEGKPERKNFMKPYYISTAIAYTSRVPHIGNTYEAVLADAIARFKRLEGFDVFFLTGTDEHGQKIEQQAKEEGITPQEHVDKIAGEIRRIWDFMNVSYDKFIRTTDEEHVKTVSAIFERLYKQGDIYKSEYEGYYCTPCESFFTATQAEGGVCPDCGAPLQKAKEEAYFFKLSKYAKRLEEYIEAHPDFIQPESRKNEMLNNFIRAGLQDLCVSRTSFTWGVPVTFDSRHIVYVWIDALSNYITALGYNPCGEHGELFKKYWPADVHLIGKDILRFHTIYWPCMLMALDLPLPKQVFGHPWLLMNGDKMSKSKGNSVYAEDLVKLFGVDATRYYMLAEMPFAADGSFTYEHMIERYNGDLANILGNLVKRTASMVDKYFGGVIPAPAQSGEPDGELIALANETVSKTVDAMKTHRVADALSNIWALLRRLNKYIDETMPWALAKDEALRPRLASVMYNLCEGIRFAGVLLSAFLPETAGKILDTYGATQRTLESLTFGSGASGAAVLQSAALFNRIDEAEKYKEIEALHAQEEEEEDDILPEISIDDFAKIDLRTAKVLQVEEIKKSKKLYKLTLDVGGKQRVVCSGIKEYYKPEELVGKNVVIVANLAPVKLCGEMSYGMVIAADDADGGVKLIDSSGIASGSKIH